MVKKIFFILLSIVSYGQNCDTTFWTADTYNIRKWQLISGVVTGGDIVLTTDFQIKGLAYDGNSEEGIFYCGDSGNLKKYVPGTGWVNLLSDSVVYNNGVYGNNHYFMTETGTVVRYYNGTTVTNFNVPCGAKDIAVDSQGRAWIFTGNGSSTTGLSVYNGNVLELSYPISFNSSNTFGTFFLNDILYVINGALTVDNPNSIRPIIINGNSASLGTPISFVCACNDAASCNVNQLGINNVSLTSSLLVIPNPTDGIITISAEIGTEKLQIFSMDGRLIKVSNENSVDLSDLRQGTYILKVLTTDNKLYTKLIEKN